MSTLDHPPIRQDTFALTLFIAASLHALLILGVGFDFLQNIEPQRSQKSLQVMVVKPQQKPPEKVEKPDFLAQANQQGSGTNTEKERPSAALKPRQISDTVGKQQQTITHTTPRAPSRQQLARPGEGESTTRDETTKPTQQKRHTSAQLLASRNLEIARITAELEQKSADYAMRPRRRSISANTREYKYAAYLDAWRRKVERIGNLNYPDEAKQKRLYGNLILTVTLRADGTIAQVRVLHSSGHKVLDDAAIRIVRLAAPYSPFPKDIREETDLLDITRTWQFLSDNRLGWK